ncbi:glycosyltransferase family 2 protein [Leptolyngbya cf. ectocarpi LEGE 11479]|uniref:Glycosyltransferase family 2 protein n=1 Tax=Leptolyngbya cf. ectocarpi LEGE 11479 TaxID=1828722 RepID=A0A929A0M2_LEPEC|nr:glycosyltransferase family A protein [Leptolyngbya ectocarpi]MBE9070818.1 glycosyltransferase family 2 protein [Leptolyngbya cf. ectocarpi LEGE 11479]
MKISIVISIAGNSLDRWQRFQACLSCIQSQSYQNYDLHVVEQSLDGRWYYQNSDYHYHPIIDSHMRGFNLSWCRNVGAQCATGDRLVLMDTDMVFAQDYFTHVISVDKFALGAYAYVWTDRDTANRFYQNCNVSQLLQAKCRERIPALYSGGYGGIVCCDRTWYWNTFGGYLENFFNYGLEDLEAIRRVEYLFGKPRSQLPTLLTKVGHLYHDHERGEISKKNRRIQTVCKQIYPGHLIQAIKGKLGDASTPFILDLQQLCQTIETPVE